MKIEYLIYVVTDSYGTKAASVVDEACVTVQICGMKRSDGGDIYFESDGYHLANWCKDEGLDLQTIEMDAHV